MHIILLSCLLFNIYFLTICWEYSMSISVINNGHVLWRRRNARIFHVYYIAFLSVHSRRYVLRYTCINIGCISSVSVLISRYYLVFSWPLAGLSAWCCLSGNICIKYCDFWVKMLMLNFSSITFFLNLCNSLLFMYAF